MNDRRTIFLIILTANTVLACVIHLISYRMERTVSALPLLTLLITMPVAILISVLMNFLIGNIMSAKERADSIRREIERSDLNALRQRIEELESILENMKEGVAVIDMNERILIVNEQALEFFSMSEQPPSCRGRSIIDVFRNSSFSAFTENLIHKQAPNTARIQIWDQDHPRSLHVNGVFIDPADTPEPRILIVLSDITAISRLEQVRKDFVANVSHELRTPITAIQGFSESILDGAMEDGESLHAFTRIILNNSLKMKKIISDLLILSKIEQQEEQDERLEGQHRNADMMRFISINIEEIIQKSLENMRNSPKLAQLPVHVSIHDNPKLQISPALFEQIIDNLMNNAMQYGGSAVEVWITVRLVSELVEIQIKDNGPGIPQRYLPRLFERFYRVDIAEATDGSGLGLAIVKHIIQVHGGTISVDSEVGSGTVFTMCLPADI